MCKQIKYSLIAGLTTAGGQSNCLSTNRKVKPQGKEKANKMTNKC